MGKREKLTEYITKITIAAGACRGFLSIALAEEPVPPRPPGNPAPAPMTDIHDIKPLVAVGGDLPWTAIAIGVLILLAMAAAVFYWRRLRKSMTVMDVVAELPPEINAQRALDKIGHVAGIDGKRFYFDLSKILRQYIFERFRLNAPEMTTEELLPQLGPLSLETDLFDGLARLCRGADPIKYAGERPEIRQMEQDLAFARKFIRDTTPTEVEV